MGDIVRLVQPGISVESVEMLRFAISTLQGGGAVPIGAALILLYPGRHFVLDLAGSARSDPTRLQGVLSRFNDELGKLPPYPERA
jgi:hypothetical protein